MVVVQKPALDNIERAVINQKSFCLAGEFTHPKRGDGGVRQEVGDARGLVSHLELSDGEMCDVSVVAENRT